MRRRAKVLSFSVPEDLKQEIEKTARTEGKTKSELFREMYRAYLEKKERQEWERLFSYGDKRAQKLNIRSEEDIERLIHEARGV